VAAVVRTPGGESAPGGLPPLPGQRVGRKQPPDGGRLQNNRATRERGRGAPAAKWRPGGGEAGGAVSPRHGRVGCVLETAPARSWLPFGTTKLNCSPTNCCRS